MAKTCAQCGKPLTFLQRIGSNLCPECQAERDRKEAEAAKIEQDRRDQEQRDATEKRKTAAMRGEASEQELQILESEGYLIVVGRLIVCPICGHDRFHQQQTLMNTRAATFFNMDWANRGADTRICERCTHVMWFARG